MVPQRVRRRGIEGADDVGVVAKGQDADVFDVLGQEILWPEDFALLVGPCVFAVAG